VALLLPFVLPCAPATASVYGSSDAAVALLLLLPLAVVLLLLLSYGPLGPASTIGSNG
jgi:hypothetical protein